MPRDTQTRSNWFQSAWLRALLSVLIVFHLFVIVVSPNSETYLGYRFKPVLEPYSKFFELIVNWNFFAPDPGPPPLFVEWELLNARGEEFSKGNWPEVPSPFFLSERQTRRIAVARFIMMGEGRAEKMLLPYLCQKHPEAASIRFWAIMYPVPALKDVTAGDRKMTDRKVFERNSLGHGFCERSKG